MKFSPLKFTSCFFTNVNLRAQPLAKNEDLQRYELDVQPLVNCPDPAIPRSWFVSLKVKISSPSEIVVPYVGELEMLGGFTVEESWPPTMIEKLVWVNGSGILYAAIREMVCAITARGFFDMLVLPSCSFAEMYQEVLEKRKLKTDNQPALKLEASSEPPRSAGSSSASP